MPHRDKEEDPINPCHNSCFLCSRKQLPATGNGFYTTVKPFLWISPAIVFKSVLCSNRGDWLYYWWHFHHRGEWEWRWRRKEKGRERKWAVPRVNWLISFYLHIMLGKVFQGVIWWILGTGLPLTTEKLPLRGEWTKGFDHWHLLKHIHAGIRMWLTAWNIQWITVCSRYLWMTDKICCVCCQGI